MNVIGAMKIGLDFFGKKFRLRIKKTTRLQIS